MCFAHDFNASPKVSIDTANSADRGRRALGISRLVGVRPLLRALCSCGDGAS